MRPVSLHIRIKTAKTQPNPIPIEYWIYVSYSSHFAMAEITASFTLLLRKVSIRSVSVENRFHGPINGKEDNNDDLGSTIGSHSIKHG